MNPMPNSSPPPVLQLRVAITSADFERLSRFYRDGLGLEPAAVWDSEQGKSLVLDLGRAVLEVFDETQAETIDRIEAGRRVSGTVRLALQVPDVPAAMQRLLDHGATLVHEPVTTPWGDTNVRLQDPDGMQVTVFEGRGE
jgi:methylmalonyl-CoA/ethylmalonyl-CoA epimerase